ncbi:gluconokinase [Gephyromycinifex aptenodytis]|uniref:gluconokinase n=1 Tax=Gephyromycinifex aptenodytis TaxID=2716227 RepID=UPI001445A551|nr:gluconokinase [Gephyromycinifex aptenodytis]
MRGNLQPGAARHIVVMGVSGCGKSTIAQSLAQRLGWEFAEADQFHPQANIDKMTSGIPLTDEDRWPWLRALAAWIGEQEAAGKTSVITCSALRRVYRDMLREGAPGVVFAHLQGGANVISERMSGRSGHFMPPELLDSQLETLEPLQEDEPGVQLDVRLSPEEIVEEALLRLGLDG